MTSRLAAFIAKLEQALFEPKPLPPRLTPKPDDAILAGIGLIILCLGVAIGIGTCIDRSSSTAFPNRDCRGFESPASDSRSVQPSF